MEMSFDQLLKVLPVVFSALGALGAWYWGYLRARKKELADPASLEAWLPSLADSLRMARYHNFVKRALDRVDGFFGEKPFGWRALTMCWLIAFAYPLILFMVTWAAGGPHTLSALEFLPADWNPAKRLGFVLVFVAHSYGLYTLVRHAEKVGVWVGEQLDRFFKRPVGWLSARWGPPVGSLVLGLLLGGLFYAVTESFVGAGAVAVAVAVAGAIAGTVAVTGAGVIAGNASVVIAGAGAVAFAFAFTGAVAGAVALAVAAGVVVAVAFAATRDVALAIRFVVAVVVAGAVVIAVAVAFAFAVFAYLYEGWSGVFEPTVVSILVFLLILPSSTGCSTSFPGALADGWGGRCWITSGGIRPSSWPLWTLCAR